MLVNNRTPELAPDEQHQGTYVSKPISVHIYEEGGDIASFSEIERRELIDWFDIHDLVKKYGFDGALLRTPAAVRSDTLQEESALADVPVTRSVGMAPELSAPYGKKVVRKPGKSPDPTPYDVMEHIVSTALSTYNDGQKEALFNQLAAELGYTVE